MRSTKEDQELEDRAYAEELMRLEREKMEQEALDAIQTYTDGQRMRRDSQATTNSSALVGIQSVRKSNKLFSF
jgi:hypothetical protein